MSAKRVTSSAIEWAAFAKKIPTDKKASFVAMKNTMDGHVRTIGGLPENKPTINWDHYKGKIDPAMFETFKKEYEALNIPYPKNTLSPKIEQDRATEKANYEKFVKESEANIARYVEDKVVWEKMKPLENMTLEEAYEALPGEFPDVKNATWPFEETEEEAKERLSKIWTPDTKIKYE